MCASLFNSLIAEVEVAALLISNPAFGPKPNPAACSTQPHKIHLKDVVTSPSQILCLFLVSYILARCLFLYFPTSRRLLVRSVSLLSVPFIFVSTLFSDTCNLEVSPEVKDHVSSPHKTSGKFIVN